MVTARDAQAISSVSLLYHIDNRFSVMDKRRNTVEADMITLLLVEDEQTVRQALKMRIALEADMQVIGEASTGREALLQAQQLQPDVVLMDVQLPDTDGFALTAFTHSIAPHSKIVMLSIYGDTNTRTRAQQVGAVSFIEKQQPTEQLLSAIRAAALMKEDRGTNL
jgi:pilus assembly protein CpaE